MDIGNVFKLDTWWKVLLVEGVGIDAIVLLHPIQIINPKYLFGLGIGMTIIGLSRFAMHGKQFKFCPPYGLIEFDSIQGGYISGCSYLFGIILSLIFLCLILVNLFI